MAQSTLLKL
ncbi:UNVERIFIED_CONTAM: hypothetical protein GTU68_044882 [Idotea baltica]|nr:hypothetical protein [Idotea baltica]